MSHCRTVRWWDLHPIDMWGLDTYYAMVIHRYYYESMCARPDDFEYNSKLLDWERQYEVSASFTSERAAATRDQFLALAAAALVPRCGASSPARRLPCTVLMDLRSRWIMRVAREVCGTLRVRCDPPANREALVHVFLGLSASGGVVRGECRLALSPGAAEGRGLLLRGSLGRGRFLASRDTIGSRRPRYSVVAWGGDVAVPDFHESDHPAVCNTRWIVFVGRHSLVVWKAAGGELRGKRELRGLPCTLYAGYDGGATFVGGNTLAIMAVSVPPGGGGGGREARPCVVFVDLKQTFADGLLTVVRDIDVPDAGVGGRGPSGFLDGSGSCMCVGDDVLTIFSTQTKHIIYNTRTGNTSVFARPCFLEIVGKEHICVHSGEKALYIYHVPDIVATNPCMSFASFGALESNPRVGTRTGIVAIPAVPYTKKVAWLEYKIPPEGGTAFPVLTGLFDVTTGMKIGVVEVKWVKSGGRPTPPSS